MKLLELYNLLEKGEITENDFATAIGLTLPNFRLRLTKWGHRLPMMLSVLDKIAEDKIGRPEAAELLDCSTRQINKLMQTWKVTRPLKPYLIERASSEIKWEIRKKFAIDYIAGSREIEDAAVAAGVSTRQMRRWVADLLMKHFEMPWKDLKSVSNIRRLKLAQEIETAEGIELAKKQVIYDIVEGKKTLKDEAIDRAIDKSPRKVANVRRK